MAPDRPVGVCRPYAPNRTLCAPVESAARRTEPGSVRLARRHRGPVCRRWRVGQASSPFGAMQAWAVHGVDLPFGGEPRSWWVDAAGSVQDRPIADAEPLPGRFVLPGLADPHVHPAISGRPTGYVPLDAAAARANLIAWAKTGITVVGDVGS